MSGYISDYELNEQDFEVLSYGTDCFIITCDDVPVHVIFGLSRKSAIEVYMRTKTYHDYAEFRNPEKLKAVHIDDFIEGNAVKDKGFISFESDVMPVMDMEFDDAGELKAFYHDGYRFFRGEDSTTFRTSSISEFRWYGQRYHTKGTDMTGDDGHIENPHDTSDYLAKHCYVIRRKNEADKPVQGFVFARHYQGALNTYLNSVTATKNNDTEGFHQFTKEELDNLPDGVEFDDVISDWASENLEAVLLEDFISDNGLDASSRIHAVSSQWLTSELGYKSYVSESGEIISDTKTLPIKYDDYGNASCSLPESSMDEASVFQRRQVYNAIQGAIKQKDAYCLEGFVFTDGVLESFRFGAIRFRRDFDGWHIVKE